MGLYRPRGSVVIDPAWALADPFIEGVARVGTADHHYGYIEVTGAVIFQPVSTAATDFHDGMATVQVDGAYGFIPSDGSYACEKRWANAGYFSEGLACAADGGAVSFIDAQGETVLPAFCLRGGLGLCERPRVGQAGRALPADR